MNMSERNYQWGSLQAKGCVVAEGSLQAQAIVCNGGLVASPRDCVGLCAVEGSLQAQGLLFALDGCCFIKLSN